MSGDNFGRITQREMFQEAAATIAAKDLEQLFGSTMFENSTHEEQERMESVQRFIVETVRGMQRIGRKKGRP